MQTPFHGLSVFCLQVGLGPWGAWLETGGSACKRCSWGIYSPKSLVVGCVLPEGWALPSSRVLAQLPSPGRGGRGATVSGLEHYFLHPAPLCTWRLSYTHLSYLCSPSPASSPDTVPPPTLSPRNAHLLVSWAQQAISPPFLHMLCLPPRVPSLSFAWKTLVNLAKFSSAIGPLCQESPSLSALGSSWPSAKATPQRREQDRARPSKVHTRSHF